MNAATLTLNIHDSIRDERFHMEVPYERRVGELIDQLTSDRGLPRYDFLGEPLEYELVRLQTDRVLARRDTFVEINPGRDELFELRGKEASLVQELIDELLEEIAENLIEEAFDKAREKLQRIDQTRASSHEIDAARRNLQRAAARSPMSHGRGAADQTLEHSPTSADVTQPSGDRETYSAKREIPKRRGRGCLTVGLLGGALVVGGVIVIGLLLILSNSGPAAPVEPPEIIATEEVIPPQEEDQEEPEEEPACEDAASAEEAFISADEQIAVAIIVNEGSCTWEGGDYRLMFVDGDLIQPGQRLPDVVPPGGAAEILMDVPGEYFEDNRLSLYEFVSPDGPLTDVIFSYEIEVVECDDYAEVEYAGIDEKRREAVFLLINQGSCVWEPGPYSLIYVEGDIILPMQDLPFPVPPGSEVEIRMPIPPEYFETERLSVYMMAREGQPFDDQAIVQLIIVD